MRLHERVLDFFPHPARVLRLWSEHHQEVLGLLNGLLDFRHEFVARGKFTRVGPDGDSLCLQRFAQFLHHRIIGGSVRDENLIALICERVEEATVGSQPSYFTVLTSGVNPWMRTSSLSLEAIGPTPLGVPVRMMSPGSSVK